MICQNETDYKQFYDNKVQMEGSVAPYISVIGSAQEPEYYLVDFDNIAYKCFQFSKALDICFKAYFVFNIAFPEACECIWNFINKQFFKLPTGADKAKPALDALLHDIRCK